ncbi:PD-(D/E)XK nuclease family protein [Breoghania sp. L-A4]|uniref:PD-(D/E)XK nuclease family protein n=1 Tax=Breoghania sp. L-A4 TaxID=2304600 RepID=UPI0020BE6381|nr:PD-(D/E)XK nuclease family protein [Breoghania sp. L-A4]
MEEPEPRHALDAALQPDQWGLVRGRLVHRLLQTLPDVAVDERRAAAARYLDAALDGAFAERREQLVSEVFGVLDDPRFGALFSNRARAEVPIVGSLQGAHGTTFAVSGQIDRLVVSEEAVLIVDYKTNARPPQALDAVPAEYIAQLAVYRRLLRDLYPDKPVRAVLLWTATHA